MSLTSSSPFFSVAFVSSCAVGAVAVLAFWFRTRKYQSSDAEVADLLSADPAAWKEFTANSDGETGPGALSTAHSSYDESRDAYLFGRTMAPAFTLELHPLGFVQRMTQMKEFVWVGISTADWQMGFAVLNFNYISTLVVQLYSKKYALSVKGRSDELLSSLTRRGACWVANSEGRYGPHASGHVVLFSSGRNEASILFKDGVIQFDVKSRLRAGSEVRIAGAARLPPQYMGLVFPLGPHRPSLVCKVAAAPLVKPLEVSLQLPGQASATQHTFALDEATLAMDYTRGLLRRHTLWRWACVTLPERRLGIHLSSGTYDKDNVSLESAVYDGKSGKAYFLNEKLTFAPLASGNVGSWSIESESMSLQFEPCAGHDGRVNARIVNVNLDHRWGDFSGHITVAGERVELNHVMGVFEDHFALW